MGTRVTGIEAGTLDEHYAWYSKQVRSPVNMKGSGALETCLFASVSVQEEPQLANKSVSSWKRYELVTHKLGAWNLDMPILVAQNRKSSHADNKRPRLRL